MLRVAFFVWLFAVAWVGGAETVSFATVDGGEVYADLYGDGAHAVILAHGGRFTKESWKDQIPPLIAAGYRVLAIDFRGRGQSQGPNGTNSDDFQFDVLAAAEYLHRNGAESIAVIGASIGGWATARASTMAPNGLIDRIVLLAHSPIVEPEKIRARSLFICAQDDANGAGHMRLVAIRDQYERAPEPKRLMVVQGSAHAQFLFKTDQADVVMQAILEFLAQP